MSQLYFSTCSNYFQYLFFLLTHFSVNRIINTQKNVKHFIAAIDEADRDRTPKQTLPGRQLTNPQEILALMSKRKKQTLKY